MVTLRGLWRHEDGVVRSGFRLALVAASQAFLVLWGASALNDPSPDVGTMQTTALVVFLLGALGIAVLVRLQRAGEAHWRVLAPLAVFGVLTALVYGLGFYADDAVDVDCVLCFDGGSMALYGTTWLVWSVTAVVAIAWSNRVEAAGGDPALGHDVILGLILAQTLGHAALGLMLWSLAETHAAYAESAYAETPGPLVVLLLLSLVVAAHLIRRGRPRPALLPPQKGP